MFDIGFAELLVIGIVALLVIGPERLPGAIRTGAVWVNRLRRGFNDIKMEVQQELHNDAVMQDLRDASQRLQQETQSITDELQSVDPMHNSPSREPAATHADAPTSGGDQTPS